MAATPEFDRTHSTFAISSSRVVTPAGEMAAAILIEHETIRKVVDPSTLPETIPVTDFGDLVISPGIVDAHVHINEPGRTEWEGFATATSAAAAGGITTIIDMPLNSSPVTTTVAALQTKKSAAAGKCHVDVGFYGGVVPGNASDLQPLIDAGVLGLKAFLCDSGLDEFPASGETQLRAALGVLEASGVPLLVHSEIVDSDLATRITDHACYQQFVDSRPPDFELAAIELLIQLCREFKTHLHIVHLATAHALPMIKRARGQGLPLTVETCPHYLYFSAKQIRNGATHFKCVPPIREEDNRQQLCQAVTTGLVDTIGSDHSPCPPELKLRDTGNFSSAWGGIAGLQLTLPIIWTVGKENGWTPVMLAQKLSARPAVLFGLGHRKGKIAAGFDADLVIWNPQQGFVVDGKELLHRHSLTPYEGCELFGTVYRTYVRGQVVCDTGRPCGEPIGKLLKRSPDFSADIARHLNGLEPQQRTSSLQQCCASTTWLARMVDGGPFANDTDVMVRAEDAWHGLSEHDWLEAFAAHPRIGDLNSLREKYANTRGLARGEQAAVDSAQQSTLVRLAEANDEYFSSFGFIFIVCATGKSAPEMLEILEQRLANSRQLELENAAAEQLKITKLRLGKLIT
ncbi:MAG: allantoinase AllB [Pirellulaceae bacterium]